MYIVKFIKSEHYDDSVNGKSIRIGTFNYYKNIEEQHLRDDKEGAGKIAIQGNNFNTDLLNKFLPKKLPENFIIRFESGSGNLIDDLSINMFVFCTTFINDLNEIETIRKDCFPGKDKHFFIANEHLFETRCSKYILHQMKLNLPNDPINIYCFTGKVTYTGSPKETLIDYSDIDHKYKPKINLRFLFEKPTKFKIEQEYRLVWFSTNKPIEDDYSLYSINNRFCDVSIESHECISEIPITYRASDKAISVWDLNK